MTKREVARSLGVAVATVWRWSTDDGIERITLKNLVALAGAIGCSITDLYEE